MLNKLIIISIFKFIILILSVQKYYNLDIQTVFFIFWNWSIYYWKILEIIIIIIKKLI